MLNLPVGIPPLHDGVQPLLPRTLHRGMDAEETELSQLQPHHLPQETAEVVRQLQERTDPPTILAVLPHQSQLLPSPGRTTHLLADLLAMRGFGGAECEVIIDNI
jgi:hypothetical protein